MKASVKTLQPPPTAQSSAAETKDHPAHHNANQTCDEPTLSPPGNAYIYPLKELGFV